MSCGRKSLTQHWPSLDTQVVSGFEPRPWTKMMLDTYILVDGLSGRDGPVNLLDSMSGCTRAKPVRSDKTECTPRRLLGAQS